MKRTALPLHIIPITWVRMFFARTINLLQKWLRHAIAKSGIYFVSDLHYPVIFVAIRYFGRERVFVTQMIFYFFFAFLQFITNIGFIQTWHGGVSNGVARDFITFNRVFSEIVPTGSHSFLIFRAWFITGCKITPAYFGVQAIHQVKRLLFFAR